MSLKRMFDKAVSAAEQRTQIQGRLGKLNASSVWDISVPNRPGYVYVRLGPDGQGGVSVALNSTVSLNGDLPILLKRKSEWGELTVIGVDEAQSAVFNDGIPAGNVPPHTHRIESGTTYGVEMQRLESGRVTPISGLKVYVSSFRYMTSSTAWDSWEGGEVDLTSYLPASNKWAWVLIGVDAGSIYVQKGADQDYSTELTLSMIDDISFGTAIPLCAIKLRDDDTVLTDWTKYQDARVWFGEKSGGLPDIETDRMLGRTTAGSGEVEELTATDVRDFLDALTDTEIATLITAGINAIATTSNGDAFHNTILESSAGGGLRLTKLGLGRDASQAFEVNLAGTLLKTYSVGLEVAVDTAGGWARSFRIRNENDNLAAAFGALGGALYFASGVDSAADPTGYLTRQVTLSDDGELSVGSSGYRGKLDVDQSSASANIPVLVLDQADTSEEFINFIGGVSEFLQPIQTGALGSYYGKVRVSVNGTHKYIPLYNN